MKSKLSLRAFGAVALVAAFVPCSNTQALGPKRSLMNSLGSGFDAGAAAAQPPPLAVAATGLDGGVLLNWTGATGADHYNVYQGTSTGAESTRPVLSGVAETTATITGLQNDTSYFFTITASGEAGESAKSVEVKAVPYQPITDAPVFSVGTGTYTRAQQVSIQEDLAGASIYYTLDGSSPTAASSRYSGALTISSTSTLRAIAVAPGHSESGITTAVYTLDLPPAVAVPVFSVLGGTYPSTQYVTISDATKGASIFYTTDGTDPSAASTPYTGGTLQIQSTTTLKAIATANNFSDSPIASVTYTIAPPASSGGGALCPNILAGLAMLSVLRRRFSRC